MKTKKTKKTKNSERVVETLQYAYNKRLRALIENQKSTQNVRHLCIVFSLFYYLNQ